MGHIKVLTKGHLFMRLNTLLATFFLAAGFLAPGQLAAAIFNINTGQAAVDPVWTITAGGSGQASVITSPIIPWVNPPVGSAWVSTTTANTLGAGATYSLTAVINNVGPAILNFQALADNQLRVYLNANPVPIFTFIGVVASDFNNLPALQTANLLGGPNTIRLDVTNVNGFSGVLLTGSVSEVPEPSTFAGMGIGLMALGWWKRRQTR